MAFSTEVSAFDVLDRIALRGPGLFPTTDVQLARWVQQEEQTESGDGSTADDAALDGRIALLWSKFRSAVGLTSDYGPRPDIEALYGYLGRHYASVERSLMWCCHQGRGRSYAVGGDGVVTEGRCTHDAGDIAL